MSENLQIFNLILNADILTKIILITLLSFSLITWSIIFDKFFKFRYLQIKTNQFQKIFWSGQLLEDIYKRTKVGHRYTIAGIFNAAMQEWESSNVIEIAQSKDVNRKNSLKDRIYDLMSITLTKSILKLKFGMNFLLIVASSATFFGLLGTVLGLMTSFQALSLMQAVTLITIAPGMTAALVTTVAGLVTAIPALIGYYVYSYKLKTFEIEMENFQLELLNILIRELEQ